MARRKRIESERKLKRTTTEITSYVYFDIVSLPLLNPPSDPPGTFPSTSGEPLALNIQCPSLTVKGCIRSDAGLPHIFIKILATTL